MNSLQSKLDAAIEQINHKLYKLDLRIKCKDIGVDPKDTVLINAITRSYKDAEWVVALNVRDQSLIFT